MIPVTSFKGRRVAVFGLGGSGLATCEALLAGGANVTAWDDGEAGREKARAKSIPLGDLRKEDFAAFDALVLAPGVPLTHPAPHWSVTKAKAAGIPVIGDVELFCRERAAIAPGAPFIAITGTNGKSTTTALIAHVLREAGRDVQMGGNIGTAILSLEPPASGRVHVVEMSSFQIDLTPSLHPSVGVLLNVTPDHLDRHGTMENYAGIKERLVAGADRAVIAVEDDWTRAVAGRIAPERLQAVRAADAAAFIDVSAHPVLRGEHNGQNVAAAAAAVAAIGLTSREIAAGLASFGGLAHRLEPLGRVGRTVFVNDSKATNADSTEKALSSYADGVFWILGGKAKEGGIAPLAPLFGRVEKAYLIGDAAEAFAATLRGKVPFERCGTLDVAVARAAEDALASNVREPVVLLSPACASYDQYPNFEVRGDHFRALVTALPGFGR